MIKQNADNEQSILADELNKGTSSVEVLNSIFYCPLGCGKLEERDNCLFNHFKNRKCKKIKLLKNKTYSACIYNAYHIVKTELLEEHYKKCKYNCKKTI